MSNVARSNIITNFFSSFCGSDKLFFIIKDAPLAAFDLKHKKRHTDVGLGPTDAGEYCNVVASAKEIVVTGGQTPSCTRSQACLVYSIEKKT